MKFMLIGKANKDYEAGVPPHPELVAAIGKLTEEMTKAGVLVGTGGLAPSSHGMRTKLFRRKSSCDRRPFY
jgi:hypothetical protein